ncbi:MAG: hypothetical protein OHK0039_28530 [Bacteroidia bacterium]
MVGRHGESSTVRIGDKFYTFFVRWLRDHVHTLKGMKYFAHDLRSGIDLYADHQREDGMIWDNIYTRDKEKNWWDKRFRYGDFIRDIEGGTLELKRIPVENDVEYLFIEGLYYTWQATGDTAWMQGHLDKAIKALDYSMKDPYRWSQKYQLLRRGFTIDTWDYQADADAARAGDDIMVVLLDKTEFGVMFGDNTGYAVACDYLAEMLDTAGRHDEATRLRNRGQEIRRRLDALAWNGAFFTHHIPENENLQRDLGVDTDRQVSLSNAYSINRRLPHAQAREIIRTYQRIRTEMPDSSPGEWYSIYPPFARGFDGPSRVWEYMNGGVTPSSRASWPTGPSHTASRPTAPTSCCGCLRWHGRPTATCIAATRASCPSDRRRSLCRWPCQSMPPILARARPWPVPGWVPRASRRQTACAAPLRRYPLCCPIPTGSRSPRSNCTTALAKPAKPPSRWDSTRLRSTSSTPVRAAWQAPSSWSMPTAAGTSTTWTSANTATGGTRPSRQAAVPSRSVAGPGAATTTSM